MTFATDFLRLDPAALPWRSGQLDAVFYLGLGNNKKPFLLVAPGAGNSVEPHVRYAAGLVLTLPDGMVAQDLGQLVVTRDRIIGMITHGSAGPDTLDGAAGSVFAFSAHLDDLRWTDTGKKKRGVPGGLVIEPGDSQVPRSELRVRSVLGSVDDDGRLTFQSSVADLLRSLSAG